MAMNDVECCDFYQVHEDVVKAVNDKMPDEDKLYDLAEIFKVFGDSTRIKICLLYTSFRVKVYAYETEENMLADTKLNMTGGFRGPLTSLHADVLLHDGQEPVSYTHLRCV